MKEGQMSDSVPTVRVKPTSPEQGDHVVINEADFDPAVHQLLDGAEPPKEQPGAGGGDAAAEAPARPARKRG
jgi:hypothetical protein